MADAQKVFELVHLGWGDRLQDHRVALPDDDELIALLEVHTVADVLRDDDLSLGRELGGGIGGHRRDHAFCQVPMS